MIKRSYKAHKETIHNFIWRSLQIFGKQGITFLIFILCAKLLTPYDFGIYNYALAIIFFLIMFGDFGISTATSKYVAEYNVTNKNKIKSVLFNSGIIILGLTIIITLLTVLIGPSHLKEKYVYILYLLPLIFLAPMTSLYDGIYRGLRKFKSLAIISIIVGLFSLSFVYYFVKVYGLIGALIAQNLFYIILLIGLGLGYKEFHFKLNKEVMKEIGKYSFILGITSISYFFFTKINTIILGHYNLINEISYYELITRTIFLLLIPFNILSQTLGPIISSKLKNNNQDLLNMYKKYIKLSIIAGLIITIIFNILFEIFLKYYLYEYYYPIIIISLRILSISIITQGAGIIASNAFSLYSGKGKINMYFLFILAPINVIINIILLKYIGFLGMITSITLIQILADIIFINYLRRKMINN